MTIKFIKKLLFFFSLLVCTSVLTGCGLTTSEQNQPNLKITLLASEEVNLNTHGKAAPLRVYIYELKTPDIFFNSDFYSLVNTPLASSQLKRLYHTTILPGETKKIEIKPVASNTMLGIVAAYRDINESGWKRTVLTQDAQPSPWWKFGKYEKPKTLKVSFGKKSISTIEWIKM